MGHLAAQVRRRLKGFAVRHNLAGQADRVDIRNTIGGHRRIGSLKAWGATGRRYHEGDRVPQLMDRSTYSVETFEGFYVNVAKGAIASWSAVPVMTTVADPFGRLRLRPLGRVKVWR